MEITATVVFIGGFLMPDGWVLQRESNDIRVIYVCPSPVASLHDRACEIFHELKGGTVDYGKDHSCFHGHNQYGRTFTSGKYIEWGPKNPVFLVGHSYGGLTARVLHYYLSANRFSEFDTDSLWVSGIITVNAPLNGALMSYVLGEHLCHPPVVVWGSVGYWLSNFLHIISFLDANILKRVIDPKLDQWRLKHGCPGAVMKLVRSVVGVTVGSNTDNAAYDLTLHSQRCWAAVLRASPQVYCLSIVGALTPSCEDASDQPTGLRSMITYILDMAQRTALSLLLSGLSGCDKEIIVRSVPCQLSISRVAGLDIGEWVHSGWDGFVTVTTQSSPILLSAPAEASPLPLPLSSMAVDDGDGSNCAKVRPGVWFTCRRPMEHMRLVTSCADTWELVWLAVRTFERDRRSRGERGERGEKCPERDPSLPGGGVSVTCPDRQPYDAFLSIHSSSCGRCPGSVSSTLDRSCAIGVATWVGLRMVQQAVGERMVGKGHEELSNRDFALFTAASNSSVLSLALIAVEALVVLTTVVVCIRLLPSAKRRSISEESPWDSPRRVRFLCVLLRSPLLLGVFSNATTSFGPLQFGILVLAMSYLLLPLVAPAERCSLTLSCAQSVVDASAPLMRAGVRFTVQSCLARECMSGLCSLCSRLSLPCDSRYWLIAWLTHVLLAGTSISASYALSESLPISLTLIVALGHVVQRTMDLSCSFQKQWLYDFARTHSQ